MAGNPDQGFLVSTDSILAVAYAIVGLGIALVLHEYARALAATRLGDLSPKQAGRLTLSPRPLVDPFGTLLLPGILLLPILFGHPFPVFAYAKPMPLNTWTLRRRDRDATLIALAGPAANVALAFVFGALLRVAGSTGQAAVFLTDCLAVTLFLGIFNLVPIPGLDGSKIVARFLSGRAQEVYSNLDQYLPLFVLLVFFLLPTPILSLVSAIAGGVCRLAAGIAHC